jgi:hypothetical protein
MNRCNEKQLRGRDSRAQPGQPPGRKGNPSRLVGPEGVAQPATRLPSALSLPCLPGNQAGGDTPRSGEVRRGGRGSRAGDERNGRRGDKAPVVVPRRSLVRQRGALRLRDGDPEFARLGLECIREESRLLGLVPTRPGEMSTAPPRVSFVVMPPVPCGDATPGVKPASLLAGPPEPTVRPDREQAGYQPT